ncbi:MAG: phenylalanine--tRNA ligase beta subunit-related protein [Oscillospiraceae bacterium]
MIAIQNELGNKAKDCAIGVLVMENVSSIPGDKLKFIKLELENSIREKYRQASRGDLKALHPMDTYISYYKKFGYTYHVLPQLESVIKGKAIPDVLPPVEAMFMAELKNMLLTAGHDLDKIKAPLRFMRSTGNEAFISLGSKTVATIPGDIMISDQESVISSILRGPDLRTAITEHTSRVLYTVYAPAGVNEQAVQRHLGNIESYVRAFSEDAATSFMHIY